MPEEMALDEEWALEEAEGDSGRNFKKFVQPLHLFM